jgi:hypothetical protein
MRVLSLPRRSLGVALACCAVLLGAEAAAQECPKSRPTDPDGFLGYDGAQTATWDTPEGGVRVWYAIEGSSMPPDETTLVSGVPDAAVYAGRSAQDALTKLTDAGFAEPPSDGDLPACASNGGDERVDVYLVNFGGGPDGASLPDTCFDNESGTGLLCIGFIVVENDFVEYAAYYDNVEEAMKTVVPHETFHLVQAAYDDAVASWFDESTAVWAADLVYPELTELERTMGNYFAAPEQPLDSYEYSGGAWPLYLATRFGPQAIEAMYIAFGDSDVPEYSAMDAALGEAFGTSLAAELLLFGAWNAATGSRAGEGGYPEAASYDLVAVHALAPDVGASVSGTTDGVAFHYYKTSDAPPRLVSLQSGEAHNGGIIVPLEDGKARLDGVKVLPAVAEGDFIVVIAGVTVGGPYTVTTAATPPPDPSAASSSAGTGGAGGGDPADGDETPVATGGAHGGLAASGGGCSVTRPPRAADATSLALVLLSALAGRRRSRGGRPGREA